jgi:hypothetical protein
MWAAYHNYRTVTTLAAVLRLTLQIRRCTNPVCPQFARPYRPEEEGRLALPKHEFGLDVIALVGTLRYFGPEAPKGKESNWVPTDPKHGFELMFRLYAPKKEFFDKVWVLPDVERIAAQ